MLVKIYNADLANMAKNNNSEKGRWYQERRRSFIKEFKQFEIKPTIQNYVGDKIKIDKILNKKITVLKYVIEKSKFDNEKDRLKLQIELNNEKRIVFTGSTFLINMIKQVSENDLPFTTTIVKEDERLEFT